MAQPNGAATNVLIRPDNIDKLPFIDDSKKAAYKNGLAVLWRQYEQNPVGSTERTNAEIRIRQASQKIMQDISKGNRPGSGAGVPQQAQVQQRPGTQGGQQPVMAQQLPGQGQQNVQPQVAQPTTTQIPPAVRQQLDSITIHVPQRLPPQQHSDYKARWYQQAAQHLVSRERLLGGGRQLSSRITQLRQAGQEIPSALQTQFENAKRQLGDIDTKWNAMRTTNEQNGRNNAMQNAQNVQNQQNNAAPVAQPQTAQQPPAQTFQAQGSIVNQEVKPEQRIPNAPAQAQPGYQPSTSAPSAQPTVMPTQPPQQQQQQQQQQPPQSATTSHPPQGFPQNQMPQQVNQRAQMNAQMPQSAGVGQVPPQAHIQTQNQQPASSVSTMPNNSMLQNQRPQPLSQQAAMAQAAEHRGQAHGLTNMGPGQPAQQNSMVNNATFAQPGAGGQSTPNSAFPPPHQMQATQQPPTNKFPIGKTVQLDPRTQTPVAGPPSRPTLANQGMLSQPGLTRPQPFTLEGEGDRVLSKRKLDELVRQVTGATDASPEAGGLSPEVEEAMLALADDFVDNVITSACRLAKIRSGQTLDIKDVQMVLERNYGIRIPGYSLDEVRTVRKFQPAPGWQSKMQAIQTAKTLGGVGKNDS